MFDRYIRPLATIVLDANNANQDAPSKIFSGFRNHNFRMRIRGTETLAGGPATRLKNAGSPWARVSSIRLDEAGTERWNLSGMEARFLSELVAPRGLSRNQRIATLADGAQALEESIFLPAAWPLSIKPEETAWLERNAKNATNLTVRWNNDATPTNPLVTTAGTITPSAYSVTIEQDFDDAKEPDPAGGLRLIRPIFLPRYRVIQQQIAAANAELPIEILTDKFLRAIVIHQVTNVGDVDDIVNSLALISDDRELIGRMTNAEDVFRSAQQEFAGNLEAFGNSGSAAQPDQGCYIPISFQKSGQLARILNPRTDINLRLILNVQPSVVAGATTSFVRVLLVELERVAGYTSDRIPFAA